MFVVEDNTGLVNATTYVSVAFADEYFRSYGNDDTWTTLSLQRKQQLLNTASRTLSDAYSFRGVRINTRQSLEFPRNFTRILPYGGYSSGYSYYRSDTDFFFDRRLAQYDSIVPTPLKNAVSEFAFRLSEEDRYREPRTSSLGIAEKQVGEIRIRYQEDQIRSQNRKPLVPRYIAQMIYEFIRQSGASSLTLGVA